MKRLLCVTSSPRKNSVSSLMANAFASSLSGYDVDRLDLDAIDIPRYDEALIDEMGRTGAGEKSPALLFYDDLLQRIISADAYAIAFPLWNLLCPPELVSFFLAMERSGVTFHYNERGEQIGDLLGRRAALFHTAGGEYIEGKSSHAVTWTRAVLNAVGVTDVDEMIADRFEMCPNRYEEFERDAILRSKALAKKWNEQREQL